MMEVTRRERTLLGVHKERILINEDRLNKKCYFVIALTVEEYNELKVIHNKYKDKVFVDDNQKVLFKGINVNKIEVIGKPLKGDNKVLSAFVKEGNINGFWHNVDNYFCNCTLEWQIGKQEYIKMGTYRYSVQSYIHMMFSSLRYCPLFPAIRQF